MSRYIYLGDRNTRPDLRGAACDPVRRADGRCRVSRQMATALVVFTTGERCVVLRRRLRLATNDPLIEVAADSGRMAREKI